MNKRGHIGTGYFFFPIYRSNRSFWKPYTAPIKKKSPLFGTIDRNPRLENRSGPSNEVTSKLTIKNAGCLLVIFRRFLYFRRLFRRIIPKRDRLLVVIRVRDLLRSRVLTAVEQSTCGEHFHFQKRQTQTQTFKMFTKWFTCYFNAYLRRFRVSFRTNTFRAHVAKNLSVNVYI